MRRIAFVTASHPWGESEGFLTAELTELASRVDLVIVPTWPRSPKPGADRERLIRSTAARHPIDPRVLMATLAELVTRPRSAWRAWRVLSSGTIRLRVRNAVVLPKAMWLARLVRRTEVTHIHAYWASMPASLAMAAAAAAQIPWSLTAHRGDVAVDNLLERKLASVEFTRCISLATRTLIEERLGRRVSAASLPVVHLGLSLPTARRGRRTTRAANVLCAARLIPLKRHSDLLEAIAALRRRGVEVRLELAGSGSEEAALRALVARLDLTGTVEFLGHVEHPSLLARYSNGGVDVVTLASEVEGIPVSLMEAMAAGVPAVATDVGGVSELLGGGAGILVPPGDPLALAEALERVITDAAVWESLAEAGRARVMDDFDSRASAARLLELIGGV
jgi:glycosyltransferase involved in cell wall biosynthesis